jgi:hypothetical protein
MSANCGRKHGYSVRPVLKLDKEGNILDHYDSLSEASRQTGYSATVIGLVCRGKGLSCGGWVWKYDNERAEELQNEMNARPPGQKALISDEERQRRVVAATGHHPSAETRKKQSEAHKLNPPSEKTRLAAQASRKMAVQQLDLAGNILSEFSSIKEAELSCGFRAGSLNKVLHREKGLFMGFLWRFKNAPVSRPTKKRKLVNKIDRVVVQLDAAGNILGEFPSIAEAARKINIGPSVISKVCRGRLKTAGGFIWKYKEEAPKND